MNFLFFAIPGLIAALAFLFVPLAVKSSGRPAGHKDQDESNVEPVAGDTVAAAP